MTSIAYKIVFKLNLKMVYHFLGVIENIYEYLNLRFTKNTKFQLEKQENSDIDCKKRV